MGTKQKFQVEGGLESEGKKWVITGISFQVSLRPLNTNLVGKGTENEEEEEECSTTPTAEEARIPESLPCPPAPKKQRPASRCHLNGRAREFFSPPDLDTVFITRVERAN